MEEGDEQHDVEAVGSAEIDEMWDQIMGLAEPGPEGGQGEPAAAAPHGDQGEPAGHEPHKVNQQSPDLNLVQHNLVHLLTDHQGQGCTLRPQEQCTTAK